MWLLLPRASGSMGIKLFSTVYHCTCITFIVKMLNHEKESFRNIAGNSDMKKTSVDIS